MVGDIPTPGGAFNHFHAHVTWGIITVMVIWSTAAARFMVASAGSRPRSRRVGLLLAVPLLACGCASTDVEHGGEQAKEPPADVSLDRASAAERIDVEFDDVDLRAAMQEISDQVGHEIRAAPDVHETLTVSLREIPWREAVEVIARMTRCEVVERDGALVLEQCSVVTVQFTDADVRTVLQLLAAYQGKEIELPESLQGKVDVDLVVAEGAIQSILDKVGGYRVVQDGDLLRVVRATPNGR